MRIDGLPVGIGSNRQPDTRLDGLLTGALMSVQTVKAVEVGLGLETASRTGSTAHDAFERSREGTVARSGNRAGGIEGGMSNGQTVMLSVWVKPIATLRKPLPSVDLHKGEAAQATVVRSDVCVVPAAAVIGEAMIRLALMQPILEKFGGDSLEETLDNFRRSRESAARVFG